MARNKIKNDIATLIQEITKSNELTKDTLVLIISKLGINTYSLHNNLWELLKHPSKDYLSTELLIEVLVLLYSYNNVSLAILAKSLEGNINLLNRYID